MSIFKAVAKIAFSPVRAVAEVVRDISGDTDEANQALSILTVGASSVIKGLSKSIKEASDEIYKKEI